MANTSVAVFCCKYVRQCPWHQSVRRQTTRGPTSFESLWRTLKIPPLTGRFPQRDDVFLQHDKGSVSSNSKRNLYHLAFSTILFPYLSALPKGHFAPCQRCLHINKTLVGAATKAQSHIAEWANKRSVYKNIKLFEQSTPAFVFE